MLESAIEGRLKELGLPPSRLPAAPTATGNGERRSRPRCDDGGRSSRPERVAEGERRCL